MELKTQNRDILGKKVKRWRKEGLIPAELFGHDFENKHLSVPVKSFQKLFKEAGKSTIIDLVLENNEKIPVLIYDVQKNPVTDEFLSIDFYKIKAGEKIETEVPIKFVGAAKAEKTGLIVVKVLNEVEIKTLPKDIPHEIEVDLSVLQNEGDAIYIKDLKLSKEIEMLTPPETMIVNVSLKKEEAEEAPPPSVEEAVAGLSAQAGPAEKGEAKQEENPKKSGK